MEDIIDIPKADEPLKPSDSPTKEGPAIKDQLLPIKFHEDTIYLIDHNGEPFVPMKPIIENLGMAWQPQHRKLLSNEKRWNITNMVTVAEDGKQREMVSLPIRKFPAFMLSIEPKKVKPEIRHKLEIYQEECDQVMWDYWVRISETKKSLKPLDFPAQGDLAIDDQPLTIAKKSGGKDNTKPSVKLTTILSKETLSHEDVVEVLKLIDQETANIVYKQAADYFGFKTLEVEGKLISTSKELAYSFGYSDTSTILAYIKEYDLEPLDIGCFRKKSQSIIREFFNLHPKDHSTKLFDWKFFIPVGIRKKEVCQYLVAKETQARIDTATYHTTGLDTKNFTRYAKYAHNPQMNYLIQLHKITGQMMEFCAAQIEQQNTVNNTKKEIDSLKQEIKYSQETHTQAIARLQSKIETSQQKYDELIEAFVEGSLLPITNEQLKLINEAMTQASHKRASEILASTPLNIKLFADARKRHLQTLIRNFFGLKTLKNLDQRDFDETMAIIMFHQMDDNERCSFEGIELEERIGQLEMRRRERIKKGQTADMLIRQKLKGSSNEGKPD